MMKRSKFTELARRTGDNLAVSLLWRRDDNRLRVVVTDTIGGREFELDAHPENALDIFYHPFAYAAFRRPDSSVETAVSCAGTDALAA
jgi:hypothetical protein